MKNAKNATFLKLQKLVHSKKKQPFYNHKKYFPQNTKIRRFAKINSRKNLVHHGNSGFGLRVNNVFLVLKKQIG